MSEKKDSKASKDDVKKRVRAGWDHMDQLIRRVRAGEATEQELAEYQAAVDRQKRDEGILGGG